jgi:hypothetical protein
MSSDLRSKVLDWLSKQGHPFELQVGRVFHDAGWVVDYTKYYEDPNTSKIREIDVVAMFGVMMDGEFFSVNAVIECKTSKEKPWIVMAATDWWPQWNNHVLAGAIGQESLSMYHELVNGKTALSMLRGPSRVGHGVLRAFHDPKAGDPSSAYAGVQSAVNAAVTFADNSTKEAIAQPPGEWWRSIDIFLPLVVTDGILFDYLLDEQGTPVLEAVPSSSVLSAHPNRANDLILTYILTVDALPDVINKLEEDLKILSERLRRRSDKVIERARNRSSVENSDKSPR